VNKPKTRHGKNSLYSEGGDTMASKMNAGFAAFIAKKKEGAKTGAKKGAMPMMAKGKKMNTGGFTSSADGIAKTGRTQGTMVTKMKRGGSCK
jgi:hypothetical protein